MNNVSGKSYRRLFFLAMISCVAFFAAAAPKTQPQTMESDVISLAGEWQFRIDREDEGLSQQWFRHSDWNETVYLPASIPENLKGDVPGLQTPWTGSIYDSSFYFNPEMEKYRQEGNVKFPFFLTPDRHYIGAAWYSREVRIPRDWKGSRIQLFLERPHIETCVWVDGKEMGRDSSLSVAHCFDLSSALTPGNHILCIRVDNRIRDGINVGPDSHSVTDQTQGNWNGIVGRMELQAGTFSYFDDIQVFPDLQSRKAKVRLQICNDSGWDLSGNLMLSAKSYNSEKSDMTPEVTSTCFVKAGEKATIEVDLPFGPGMLTWDEFQPALYRLSACLKSKDTQLDAKEISFGMREISIDGRWIYINGRKTLMRGTVENCCFPQTGYAPMDVASWERIFRVCKRYGLNHMRFHSFCPPEAAFQAADLVGMYLQPEGPSWPNHGSGLGYGWPIDNYLMAETQRMAKQYGNYASFCMLACGNEPRGRWVKWVSDFVDYWKEADSRRIYTGASVGGGWEWQPKSQYHVKAGARGVNWQHTRPESVSDFRMESGMYKGTPILEPFISHETGQWCAFPDFDQIKKYTGVNKAKNFELFREHLSDHDMGNLGHDFMMASGKLQLLCYKHEIEKTLRTPDYAGFQLLSLNDYSGQGSALVGVLDVFWDEKGYATAEDFSAFCGPTVPLIRTPKFVYTNQEILHADAEIAHFGPAAMKNAHPVWTLSDENGVVIKKGEFPSLSVAIGNGQKLGTLDMDLGFIQKAGRYRFSLGLEGTDILNYWDFHIYPVRKLPDAGKVMIAEEWNEQVAECLQNGGDVLLLSAGKVRYGSDVQQYFQPVFWNTSWFKMRPPHTTGILVNPNHPVFKDFPTDYYADFQWWEIVNQAQVMRLTEFPKGFQPLIQSIDTWFLNRKIGMLIEARVGAGRLMMTTADLQHDLENRPAAKQLYISILNYMNSIYFRPGYEVSPACIEQLFAQDAPAYDSYTKAHPDELKPKQGGE